MNRMYVKERRYVVRDRTSVLIFDQSRVGPSGMILSKWGGFLSSFTSSDNFGSSLFLNVTTPFPSFVVTAARIASIHSIPKIKGAARLFITTTFGNSTTCPL